MRILIAFFYLLYGFHAVLAQSGSGWIETIFKQVGACFPTVKSSGCTVPLHKNFKSKYPVDGDVEPTTLVYLFTPKSPDAAELIHECGGLLADDTTYDPDANTEIFVHGYLDGICRTGWMRECKEQLYLRSGATKEKFNVILVDWTWGNTNEYFPSVNNLKIVGDQIAFIIKNIMQQKSVGPEKFHLIGHSLGAHIHGYASRILRNMTSNLVRRITALDPALPEFLHKPPWKRVTYRDAHIVDVIHTDASLIPYLYFGDIRHVGHADFYPNGGDIQLGCYTYIFDALLKGDYIYALVSLIPMFCFHLQALQYYKISINPEGCEYVGINGRSYSEFLTQRSTNASDWAVMGMDFEKYYKNDGVRKKYYLSTSDLCPFYDDSYLKNDKNPFKTTCKTGLGSLLK